MNTSLIALRDAVGKKLAVPILRPDGRKIMAKGHQLAAGEVAMLANSFGVTHAWVTELEPGEVSEEEVLQCCAESFPGLEFRVKSAGQAYLVATHRSVLVVNRGSLDAFNTSGVAVLATKPPFALLEAGKAAAVLRSRPYGSPGAAFAHLRQQVEQGAAIVEAKPLGESKAVMLCTDPVNPARARDLLVAPMQARWGRLGIEPRIQLASEDDVPLLNALLPLVRLPVDVIVVASTVSPAGPDDVLGRVVRRLGGTIDSFLAPVEPGTLLMVGRVNDTAIVSAPGCCRTPKTNVLDIVLPPLLAGHRLTAAELGAFGPGGFLE